jgi:hypothetical protein
VTDCQVLADLWSTAVRRCSGYHLITVKPQVPLEQSVISADDLIKPYVNRVGIFREGPD